MKVSIGLPIYNCESTVKLTVQSIFAQTYQDWELIIVDDGSKDRSLEIVRRIEDRRVRILADGKNRQLSYRLNQLAEMSQGQFIARMDADDLMHPERLQRQVSYFNHHPTCHILGTSIYLINHLSEICGQASTWQSLPAGVNFIQQSLYFHPTVMAKTEWYRANKYDGKYVRAEDMEFWCRAMMEGKTNFGFLDEPLLYYRKTGVGTISKTLETLRTQRRISLEYGPSIAGIAGTVKAYLRSHLSGIAHRMLEITGMRESYMRKRDQQLTMEENRHAADSLDYIKQTHVPGWDTHLVKSVA